MCKHVETTEIFRSFSTQREYYIKPNNSNCRPSNAVYLFSWKLWLKRYAGRLKFFDLDLTVTCKSVHMSLWVHMSPYIIRQYLKQTLFHVHFKDDRHNGINDWQIVWTVLGKENLFGSINSAPSSQMGLMIVRWHFFDVLFNLTLT